MTTLTFGAASAAAWIPCVGPTLSEIYGLMAMPTTQDRGMVLLLHYGGGLAGILFGLATLVALLWKVRVGPAVLQVIRRSCGILLMVVAKLILSGHLNFAFRWDADMRRFFHGQ